jgi:hypothetical protein
MGSLSQLVAGGLSAGWHLMVSPRTAYNYGKPSPPLMVPSSL